MATTIDQCYSLTKYPANKSGYGATLSPDDFNMLWRASEIKYYERLKADYAKTQRISESLSKFQSDPTVLTLATSGSTAGQYTLLSDFWHVDSLTHTITATGIQWPIIKVEKDRLANYLSSSIDAPSLQFPIYTQFKTYLQFYPLTLASATLVYLKQPTYGVWGYTINGIATYNTLVGGSLYTTGTYTNIALTGGTGLGATANITVAGGVVTAVTIVSPGKNYVVGNVLSATAGTIGGTGSGFSITVATIGINRPIYDSTISTQPQWYDFDIQNIVNLLLQQVAQNQRDQELAQYSQVQEKQGT